MMGAKRVLLIAGGTIGGLGAVLSITPPQFGSTAGGTLSGNKLGGGTTTPVAPAPTQASTPAPTETAAATPVPTATKKATKKKGKTATTAPAPAATTAAQVTPAKASGTFTGTTQNTRFGPVQVQITLSNGKITAAKALQYPNNDFRSQSISQQAIPFLVQETLAANSANIQGVGGASYTSQGWYDSLVSALAKAGM
jgi:uncharacterized protein with FMN-binding domain